MYYAVIRSDELYHHGILGQKWGVRRYQNEDGSLTSAGREHYGVKTNEHKQKELNKLVSTKNKTYSQYKKLDKNLKKSITKEQKEKLSGLRKEWHESIDWNKYNWNSQKSIDKAYDKNELYKKYSQELNNVSNELIGKYGDTKISQYVTSNDEVRRSLDRMIESDWHSANFDPKKSQSKKEELKVVKDTIKNYDMSDPYAEEALELLKEIERDSRK